MNENDHDTGPLPAASGRADSAAALRRGLAAVLLVLLLAYPVSAVYGTNGIQLHSVVHGKHHGTVSVSGGHGLAATPYSQSFTVPAGTVRFARLYVGVWGGTPEYTGTLETSLNGASLGRRTMGGGADTNSQVFVSGYGVHWSAYDVTDRVRTGANTATATTAGEIDGRVYGMVLAVATEDPSAPEIEYWFAEGNENLNKDGNKDSASLALGAGPAPASVTGARLYVTYIASTRGDGDQLLFNGQSIATDAAGASSGAYFDMRSYDVTSLRRDTATVGFGRGDANRLHPVFVGYVATLAATPTSVPATAPTTVPPTTVPPATAPPAAAAATAVVTTATSVPLTTVTTASTIATAVAIASVPTTAMTMTTVTTVTTGTPATGSPLAIPTGPTTVPAVTATAPPDGTPVVLPVTTGTAPDPTSTANASAVQAQGTGPAVAGAVPGHGSLGDVIAADAPGIAVAVVIFSLIVGAGIIVFSLIAGAGLLSYMRLAGGGREKEAPAPVSGETSRAGTGGQARGTPDAWRRSDDE